jgi:cardiolipin synthase
MLAFNLLKLRKSGFDFPAVHYVGKAGTLMLLYSVPFIFLGNVQGFELFRWFGIAWLWWGIGTYWAAGLVYRNQIAKTLSVGLSGSQASE